MKRLSDYVGEDAIDLWADLMTPLSAILTDKNVQRTIRAKGAPITIARDILKNRKAEAIQILTRIDDTPINGANVITRLMALVSDLQKDDGTGDFFEPSSKQDNSQTASTGSATENIGDGVN